MARHSAGTVNDIEEWAEATRAAREVRALVAEQLRVQVIDADVMGSAQVTGRRARAVLAAERTGDLLLLRGAVFELAVSAAAWVAAIDARLPATTRSAA